MAGRSTIDDVSKLAGVSTKTVSRVLNDHQYVRDETRKKVEDAMAELGFRPSIAARILAGNKSKQIALIYDNHSPYYMNQVQEGCWSRCQEEGIRLLSQPVDVLDPDVGRQVLGLIAETHVDGVVLSSPATDCQEILDVLEGGNIPYVRMSPGTDRSVASSVFMDDAQAADDLTTYLIEIKHKRIGFIIGHHNHAGSQDRLFGYRRALDRAGIGYEPQLVRQGEFDFDSGTIAAEKLLDLSNPPTAIFASNDDMAAGVLAVAHRRSLSLPHELSVAGFDDTTLARMLWPPLTTVHQPMRELAYAAVELVIGQSETPVHQQMDHKLVIRQSTIANEQSAPNGAT